jgi:LEA14-like dessication related protein
MKRITFTLLAGLVLLASCGSRDIKEPEFRDIQNVHLVDVGLLQTTAAIDLVYYNPNNTAVQLTDARGDVYVDNAYLGHFTLGDKVQVGKRLEFIVPALIKLDNIGAIKNQKDILKKKDVLIRINGTARVKKSGFSQEVPISYESMQSVDRLRSIVIR